MKAADFHLHPAWEGRTVHLSDAVGPSGWRAAQCLAHAGARVLLSDFSGRERLRRFETRCEERGLTPLLLQRGSEPRGDIRPLPSAGEREVDGSGDLTIPTLTPTPHAGDVSGGVTLVGGGPGDPELLTVAALRALAHADVVFVDRLGIAMGVRDLSPAALLIDVGKAPGRHKLAQERINEEMHVLASDGASVVRLKGGDVFVFGRGGEEWRYLASRGIRVDVVPGITSALSVPARAGISATYREVTRAITIISGHQPFNGSELRALVDLGSTIIILMGIATFPSTVAGLLRAGLAPTTGVALLEQGFTPGERHTFATLDTAVRVAEERGVSNPAIIVIGDVVEKRQLDATLREAS